MSFLLMYLSGICAPKTIDMNNIINDGNRFNLKKDSEGKTGESLRVILLPEFGQLIQLINDLIVGIMGIASICMCGSEWCMPRNDY